MKLEIERFLLEQEEEGMRFVLPETFCESEYVLIPGFVKESLIMLTQKMFEEFQQAAMQASAQGIRLARIFMMNAYFAELEEGTVLLPCPLLEKTGVKADEVWCVKEEEGRYHLATGQALADLFRYLERKKA